MKSYHRVLNVRNKIGRRVWITVIQMGTKIRIISEYIPEVEKAHPRFSHKGTILMTVDRVNYLEAVKEIETYLTELFEKGESNEDNNTSIGNGTFTGRTEGTFKRRHTVYGFKRKSIRLIL